MKHNRSTFPILAMLSILAAILACNLPGRVVSSPPSSELQNSQTDQAQLAGDTEGSNTLEAPTDTLEPEASETPEPSPTIEHLTRPGEPAQANTWVTDNSTKALAASRESNSDQFNINFLERPFTSEVMDYQAWLDLVRVNLNFSSPWVYVTFVLEGSPPADSTALYALEVDLDRDGRGDWLILGQVPADSEWTTDAVQAYRDANGDVGGLSPMNSDAPDSSRDGYETLVFDQGIGADPDAVWVRRDPGNPNQVQLAFKYSLIGNADKFAFGGWADDGLKNPGAFDYNDFLTLDQAGSPFSGNSKYPIKELASVDNTCRWTYGYTPTTNFPGLCPLPPTPTPTATLPPPSSIAGGVFNDMNNNGARNGGEPGLSSITVKLGSGACGSSGLATKTTSSDGSFTFNNLSAGTYCVSVNIVTSCGGWAPTTVTQRTVVLGPGENKLIAWFGYARYIC